MLFQSFAMTQTAFINNSSYELDRNGRSSQNIDANHRSRCVGHFCPPISDLN